MKRKTKKAKSKQVEREIIVKYKVDTSELVRSMIAFGKAAQAAAIKFNDSFNK